MEMEMETAGEPLSIQTTDRTVALQLPRQKGVCILTRLSPVSGKERAFALVPQLPSDACSHDTLVGGWSSVTVLVSTPGTSPRRRRGARSSSQKDGVGHVDEGVGRLGGRVAHDGVWWVCRLAIVFLSLGL